MTQRKYYATIRGEMLHTETLKELSELYCEIRDETGEGCSTFRPVNVGLAGTPEIVGHISYNGRVWTGLMNQLENGTLLYDNRITA